MRKSADHVNRTYATRASHASSHLIPPEQQVQAEDAIIVLVLRGGGGDACLLRTVEIDIFLPSFKLK